MRKLSLMFFLFLIINKAFSQETQFVPPIAKRIPKVNILHGDTIIDYYAWIRNKDSIDVINYLYAENAYTDNMMKDTRLLQKKLYEEFLSRINENYVSLPYKDSSYFYYSRYEKGNEHPFYCRKKDSITAKEQIYLDLNQLAKQQSYVALQFSAISPDHRILAYCINNYGGDAGKLFFKYIDNDSLLDYQIDDVSSMVWANDNQTVFYVKEEPKTKKSLKIFRHTLGNLPSQDTLIFEEKRNGFYPSIGKSSSEQYLILGTANMVTSEYYFLAADKPFEPFVKFEHAIAGTQYYIDHLRHGGDSLWITTNWKAPNYRVMKAPIAPTPKENWVEFFPHNENQVLQSFSVYKNHIVYNFLRNGLKMIAITDRNNQEIKSLQLNEDAYTMEYSGQIERHKNAFLYSYTSLKTPYELHEFDLGSFKDTILYIDTLKKYNAALYETKRIWATGHDSVKIPIDIVYKKGLQLNGSNPVYLYAYACYGSNTYPGFSKLNLSYIDRGFVYAIAHPRGESLLGNQWHDKGKLLNKKNTYLDFIACAEYLIKEKYTSPKHIVIQGGSAGGMLVGAVLTMRPDLFKAAIADVPFVDVLNDMQDTTWSNIIYHYDEIGNPNIKKHYEYIKSWCPYQNVSSAYPDLLVTCGYNDSRVPYRAPTKWVAKMRSQKQDSSLLLLKANMEAGHFGLSGRYAGLKEDAFKMAFLMKSLDFKEDYIVVKGKILDENSNALPFVNVYIKGTAIGTTSNFDGDFALEVRKDQPQEIVFQYIGFKRKTLPVIATERTDDWKITMESEHVLLKEVKIYAKSKDPAYEIIKKAQDERKHHLDKIKTYSADIYIKGAGRLDEIPEKLPFFIPKKDLPDSNDIGLLSITESITKLHYQKPDNQKEEMIASKISGMRGGYSWNRAKDVSVNFYENQLEIPLSTRPFITPISSQALFYYKYKLIESIYEDGKFVYKIQVIPRRKADPVFKGFIYINEGDWSINSVDLTVTNDAQVEFTDSIVYKQSYVPVMDSIYMPLSLHLAHHYKLFGFRVTGNYVAYFSNYKINHEFPAKFFRNEVFKIEENANKKDSAFWEETRPYLLTDEEIKYYTKEDSAYNRRQSKEYLDSVDKKYNKYGLGDLLINGYSHFKRSNNRTWRVNSLLGGIMHYNTVEGFAVNVRPEYYRYFKDSEKSVGFEGDFKYSEARNAFNAMLTAKYYFNFKRFEAVKLQGGSQVTQYNEEKPIKELINTAYTLFAEENYAKYYEKQFIKGKYRREIINGLIITSGIEFQERIPLQNNTDFTFNDYKNKAFSSNNPLNPANDAPAFDRHQAIFWDVKFSIRFKQQYESFPDYKRIIGSKYPELYIYYRKGIKALNSAVNFDYIEGNIGEKINFKQLGMSNFDIIAGTFLNTASMSFLDYKHFNGNLTHIKSFSASNAFSGSRQSLRSFDALDYYAHSTNDYFFEAHYEHSFNGWIINKFPYLRKTKWQTVVGSNFLYTKQMKEYTELFIGVKNIFKFLRIDFVTHYQNNKKIEPELRFGLSLGGAVTVSDGNSGF